MIDFIIASVVGIGGFFLGARKTSKETDSISIQNVAASLSVYQEIIEDLRRQISEMQKKMTEMDVTIQRLEKENKQLKDLMTVK